MLKPIITDTNAALEAERITVSAIKTEMPAYNAALDHLKESILLDTSDQDDTVATDCMHPREAGFVMNPVTGKKSFPLTMTLKF